MTSVVWGLSYGHHDAAAVVIKDSEVVYAERSEQITGVRCDKNISQEMVDLMLDQYGVPQVVYLHENKKRDLWRKIKSFDWARIKTAHPILPKQSRIIAGNHHLSHAATGYYTSGFDDALVIVADAIGELESLAVFRASNHKLDTTPLHILKYPHSLGLFYSYHVAAVGMEPGKDENKFMSLSDPSAYSDKLIDGYHIDGINFNTTTNFHHYPTIRYQTHTEKTAVAETVQTILETYFIGLAKHFGHISSNLVFTGGVAYNTRLQSKLASMFDRFYVPSHPGDAGSALGAILQHTHQHVHLDHALFT